MRQIHEMINDPGTLLVDVRTVEEVREVSVPGAENIPLHTVPLNLDRFRRAQGDIVLFCRSGGRSQQAVDYLKQNGISRVFNAGSFVHVLSQRSY